MTVNEKCNSEKCNSNYCYGTVVITMIAVSVFEIGIGFYIGFVLKDIVLLASVLLTIMLFVGLLSEFTWLFKDHLNKNERELAEYMDISKLKKNTY